MDLNCVLDQKSCYSSSYLLSSAVCQGGNLSGGKSFCCCYSTYQQPFMTIEPNDV
uniref:Uncharacterized protein n=1 Tax=Tetranychus urticae TaxID=32264 RepID=T1JR87_TETUR